jgi:hypothetical protein
VRIQALCPGFTFTEFHATPEYASMRAYERIPGYFWDAPEKVVAASPALPHGPVVCPFLKNKVIALGGGLVYRLILGSSPAFPRAGDVTSPLQRHLNQQRMKCSQLIIWVIFEVKARMKMTVKQGSTPTKKAPRFGWGLMRW